MRLTRPYIPLRVRVQVAERQAASAGVYPRCEIATWTYAAQLRELLYVLFGDQKVELHHRPALCNRPMVPIVGSNGQWAYVPDANDPDYLVYLPADEHDIETRVRGQHGDYSDLAKARKRKRKEKREMRKRNDSLGNNRWNSRKRVRKSDVGRSTSSALAMTKRKMQQGIKAVSKEMVLRHGITSLDTGTQISGVTDVVPEFRDKPYPRVFCKHGVNLYFRCLACNPKRKWPKRKLRSRNDLRKK